MPIQVTCTNCGNTYSVPNDRAGRTERCKCGQLIQLPRPAAVPPPQDAMNEHEELQRPDQVQCPHCGMATRKGTLELSFEVQVLANEGRAVSVVVPFAGVLRLFPNHVVMAHRPSLRVEVTPGQFHSYRILSRVGRMELYIDGELAWDTDKGDSSLKKISAHLPAVKISSYGLAFGNEVADSTSELYWSAPDIVPEVTGYSIWRRVEAITDDPQVGRRVTSWVAERDGFPDQYQLDHIVEVEASTNGYEQGYSGWIQLDDGRIFVVHYTDDAALSLGGIMGIPWIRGTFLEPSDLPPTTQ